MLAAQPHLSGKVKLDRIGGHFECDFVLSNIPELAAYRILLNHGMNIKYFKNEKDSLLQYHGYYDGEMKGEALAYVFKDTENDTIPLPREFKVSYSGGFPVYRGEYNAFDYKGYIAFNEKTVRATEQSKWYPVLYDVENDRLIDSYTYEIEIEHSDSRSVFLNRSAPTHENPALLQSKKSAPLFLFAGEYDYMEIDGNYFINTGINREMGESVIKNSNAIKNLYSVLLGKEFTDHIYLINFEALRKLGPHENWGFNIYPSFAYAGLDFNNLLDETGRFWASRLAIFAHEMAHNYFGPNVMSGKYFWFWLESVPEYLSMIAMEELRSRGPLEYDLKKMIEAVKDKNFIPLAFVREPDDIDIDYRYRLGPLVLKVFEGHFGKERTIGILHDLLDRSISQTLDLETWEEVAVKNGIAHSDFADFRREFLEDKNFVEATIKWIEEKELK
jgi:hypothetical protein